MVVVNTQWKKTADEVLKTPKFLKRGTKVMVNPETIPHPIEVEGRYGVRTMYVIECTQHGLVYVSPLQLVKIVAAFGTNFDSAITVEL